MSLHKPTVWPGFKSEAARAQYLAAYDAALAEWPVPFEVIDAPTGLGPTHVIASGPADAPPLVLLPSFAGTALVWRLNVEALSQHFRVFCIDVIGQPGRSEAHQPLRKRRQYAAWLNDVLDRLGVARASIVGCSFGGFLAMNQAVSAPERVDRIVMISPVGTFASQDWRLFWLMRVRGPITRLVKRLTRVRKIDGLEDIRGPSVRAMPNDRVWADLMADTMSTTPTVSVILAAVFSRRQLRAVRAPALLLIGDGERLYDPQAMLALAAARMPGLKGEIVRGADHIAAMAQPEAVNERLLAFLA